MNALILGHLIHRAIARNSSESLFLRAFTIFGMASPLLMVVYAFAQSDDPFLRASMLISGLEKIVLALVVSLAVRALFALGRELRAAQGGVGEAAA